VNKPRPVYLNLFEIRLPLAAFVSILHRASGALLFLSIPFVLWVLDASLHNRFSFYDIRETLAHPVAKVIMWGILSAFIYHLVAGIRHFFMDCGIGETKEGGFLGAQITLGVSAVLIILLGIGIFL
jgi:succinate dehydrogenase / fumarate reductase cytochrome b subunit